MTIFLVIAILVLIYLNYYLDFKREEKEHKKWMKDRAAKFEAFCDSLDKQSKIEEDLIIEKYKTILKTRLEPPNV